MQPKTIKTLIVAGFLLGLGLLLVKYSYINSELIQAIINQLSYLLFGLLTLELLFRFILIPTKLNFFRANLISLVIWWLTILIFYLIHFHPQTFLTTTRGLSLILGLLIVRYGYHVLQIISSIPKLSLYLEHVLKSPARTIALSFLVVIFIGTLLLWMPPATTDGHSIGIINAIFTATSAVCVTGLIVVDTATRFSLFGKLVLLALIQVGGLGIMILSYFAAFIIGKRVSLEEKLALSYALNEREIRRISTNILRIIVLTFTIELLGAILLTRFFEKVVSSSPKAYFYALFHAVSAFCNAGFALFSNSLMDFRSDFYLNSVVCFLIITGGLSFVVLANIIEKCFSWFRNTFFPIKTYPRKLSLNTRAVLSVTLILLAAGTLLIYALEHPNQLLVYDLPTQYLSAFFQAVTLRTAGFNTIDIGQLRVPTLLIMCIFMFIGAASGSTGGGVKVNTVFVIFAYIKTLLTGKTEVVSMQHTLSRELVARSFLIIILGLVVVSLGTILLTMTENFDLPQIIFEVTSAFGTVGLSTGITPALSKIGKLLIISIMFIGRIGPMTLILAISKPPVLSRVRYPEEEIIIG